MATLFYFIGFLAVISALFVVINRNPVYSAVMLVFCFFSLASLYVLLEAYFVAVLEIIVYAGAIMVLFLFVIMLINVGNEIKYSGIFISDGTSDSHCLRCDSDKFASFLDSMDAYYVMAIDFENHYENGNWYYSVIYADSTYGNGGSYGFKLRSGQDKNTFLNDVSSLSALGYNLIDVEIDYFGEKFSSLYSTKPANVLFYWDLDYDDLISNASTAASNGYYPTDIEIHEINGVKKYNVILNYGSNEWDYLIEGSYEEFDAKNTIRKNTGYRPIDFEVHTSEERNIGRVGDNLSVKNKNLVYINPKLKRRN